MKQLRTQPKQTLWYALLLLATLVVGCSAAIRPQLAQEANEESLLERLAHETSAEESAHNTDGVVNNDVNIESLLTEVDYGAVQNITAVLPFHTLVRKDEITQYPCSNCHIAPLTTRQAEGQERTTQAGESQDAGAAKAHWDIMIEHAETSVMNCTTCHTADDMDALHTLTGDVVDFNHSYQLCAQCHGQQHEDWLGGAHGKRVGGWAPPRVVENCVECHNPHQPAWDIRWPAVTNAGLEK